MSTETHEALAAGKLDDARFDDSVPPMLGRSLDAFRRDLPRLLKTHYGKWVAYHGDAQVGFGRTETELYAKCLAQGMKRDEFLVCSIEPEIPDEEICWSYGL